jgi:hypothetical protein
MTTSRNQRSRLLGAGAALLILSLIVLVPGALGAWGGGPAERAGVGLRDHRVVKYRPDPDHDHLSTRKEVRRYHTRPHRWDSDGDGYGDGQEVQEGTDPRDPTSTPSVPPLPPTTGGERPTAGGGETPTLPGSTEPQTTIDSGPPGSTTATAAIFTFSSPTAGASFECRFDGSIWARCSSPRSYSGLAAGKHAFAVRAIAPGGQVDATQATWRWKVVTEPAPSSPEQPTTPETPAEPESPTEPETPAEPESPTEPEAPGAPESPTEPETPRPACTQTLSSGANVSSAISNAAGGAIICLPPGSSSFNVSNVNKGSLVTLRGTGGTLGYSMINKSSGLRLESIHFTGGLDLIGATSNIQIMHNEFTGSFGIHAGGEAHSVSGSKVSNVVIEGNYLHDLDYTGTQGVANGYGITALDGVSNFVIRGNTIKSPASDYIQSASPVNFVVDHNTFLGPSLLGSHADHQDLWQVFGGGSNLTFTNNVARDTETQESLLFQEAGFSNVVVENNLFDHDSKGYTCQIYQSTNLTFRNNTIVGSHWGCLFRDTASASPGSNYQVDHNVFVGTESGSDISTEGRASSWGAYDYNVSGDGSASGSHSIRNWKPSWSDATNFVPAGLSFTAGYRP